MQYGRTIAACLPLMMAAAVASTFFVSLQQAVVGYALGIAAGVVIAHRGVRLLKSQILQRNRSGFGPMRRSVGILVFFILPAFAGGALGFLFHSHPDIVMTVALAGSSAAATWWLLTGWWVWRVERRTGREVLLFRDGFCLSAVDRHNIKEAGNVV